MYSGFSQCNAALTDIEAIDFYFAQTLCDLLKQDAAFSETDLTQAFHVLLALSVSQRQGNACLILDDIADQTLFTTPEKADSGWEFSSLPSLLALAGELAASPSLFGKLHLIDNRLYSARYWQFEQDIKAGIAARLSPVPLDDEQYQRVSDLWPALFNSKPAAEQDWQQVATALSLNQRFAIISGGPGTGKTYTIARLLMAMQSAWNGELSIMLTAPTGKAAQRLSESIDAALSTFMGNEPLARLGDKVRQQAMTLHRLLGMPRWGINCRVNADRPLNADVVVVDESSMIDLALMARLFRALSPDTRIILVGDPNQLPSVEAGNVLGDILAAIDKSACDTVSASAAAQFAKLCPHLPALDTNKSDSPDCHFTLINAQRFGGDLAEAAGAISAGDAQTLVDSLDVVKPQSVVNTEGVARCEPQSLEKQFAHTVKACFEPINQAGSLSDAMQALQNVRWLTPFRQGEFGAIALNERIETLMSPTGSAGQFYRGKPIMVVENHYSLRLFNGDVGIVWPAANGQLKAWFVGDNGAFRAVPLTRLPRFETVYAMTIHKSQGSEFAQLLLCLPEPPSKQAAAICTRELVYTGLTRAKRGCVIMAEPSTLRNAVALQQRRKTGVKQALAPLFNGLSDGV